MSVSEAATRPRRATLLIRDSSDAVLAGVAAAVARRIGVDAAFVRVGFAVLSFAGGAGAALYLLLWALSPQADRGDHRVGPPANHRRATAFGIQVFGLLVLFRSLGLWLGDPLVWPLAVAAFGWCVLWGRSDDGGRARWSGLASRDRPLEAFLSGGGSVPRRLIGGALAISGLIALLAANLRLADVGVAVVAFMVAGAGFALLAGPAAWRLLQQVGEERRERVRSEERAEIGAHLHDSVLHTLALIQRSESPQEMATLARSQERELRSWLQGRTASGAAETVQSAIDAVAARVEANQHVAVDVVVVGDAVLDAQLTAAVAAVGEAATNAARHSGVGEIAVYVEVEPATITAYVRDEGRGFDPATVPGDRRGIADSIRGRIERHGGTVTIDSGAGDGTEVTMTMPRGPS